MPQSTTTGQNFLEVCEEMPDTTGFIRGMLNRFGDKWSLLVIATLAAEPRRFTELQRAIPPISHRMLTVTLRSLTVDGLVDREAFGGVPPRVEYSLTPLGETLLEPVLALMSWAGQHREEIEERRFRHGVAAGQ